MIIHDKYGISWIVSCENQLDTIYTHLLSLFSHSFYDYSITNELSHLQIHCASLLLSMEKNKHNKSKDIFQLIDFLSKKEKDNRSSMINLGLSALLSENYSLARDYFYQLLLINNKDFFAFFVTHMIEFNNGMTSKMLQTLSVINKDWDKQNIFYGYCKGIESFILNENCFYNEGKLCGEEALRLNPNDIYAIHAICHHYYDTQAYQEGLMFMDQNFSNWKNNYGMRLHLYWHYAIFLIKCNQTSKLPVIYQYMRNKNNATGLEDLDATSFLFRLSLSNDNIYKEIQDSEIQDLVNCWNNPNELGFYFFNDFHAALIFSLANRVDLIDYLISKTEKSIPIGYLKAKTALLEAIRCHTIKDYLTIINILKAPINYQFMGGSHAQRSIIQELLKYAQAKMEAVYEH